MAVPHLPLIEHTVKKGDNLTRIVKKYGHPGGEWKAIYNAYYNKAFKAKFKDPNLIQPGEVFQVPSVTRKKLEEIIYLIWDVQDWTKAALAVDKKVYAELKALKKERVKTAKSFRRAKANLNAGQEHNRAVRKLADQCMKADKDTGKKLPLGTAVKCMTDALNEGYVENEMKFLEKMYLETAIDNEKVEKKIAEIEKKLAARQRLIDGLVAAQQAVSEYLGRNHKFFFG